MINETTNKDNNNRTEKKINYIRETAKPLLNRAIGVDRENEEMKKDAIIELLENDLKEIATLVETFREPEKIGSAFLELLRQKHETLGKEIRLLDYWATDNIAKARPAVQSVLTSQPLEQPSAEKSTKTMPRTEVRSEEKPKKVEDYFAAELETMEDPLAEAVGTKEEEQKTEEKTQEETRETETRKEEAKKEETRREEKRPEPRREEPKVSAKKAVSGNKAADIAQYGTPVDDINKAIGINDRFLFMRELFGGDKMAFDAAIETVNAASSYEQAHEYFRQQYSWEETDDTVELFLKAVHRRFL